MRLLLDHLLLEVIGLMTLNFLNSKMWPWLGLFFLSLCLSSHGPVEEIFDLLCYLSQRPFFPMMNGWCGFQ